MCVCVGGCKGRVQHGGCMGRVCKGAWDVVRGGYGQQPLYARRLQLCSKVGENIIILLVQLRSEIILVLSI